MLSRIRQLKSWQSLRSGCHIHKSQRYLFNAIPNTNHNANPTNPNRNSKGKPNPTNPTNPITRYRCEYGTRFSRIAQVLLRYH